MGNSASSARNHNEETVDFGFLVPQGVYTGLQDWNQGVVAQLIVQRKLAPFYRPLEDYDESWDDEQILAARRESQESDQGHHNETPKTDSSSSKSHNKRPSAQKEMTRYPEAALYRGATECPICFLYYPANINHSRCCNQAICTECFVQIKRSEPTTTHMVSDPASCPYCVQEKFGVVYTPPPWRAGIGSEGSTPPSWPDSPMPPLETSSAPSRRRRSYGPDSPDVVTIDQIRPDWEAKLAALQAAAQRRANRRIIMRQVGDRLIPVGISSGRVHALPPEEVENGEALGSGSGSRRSRRRQQNADLQQILGQVGMAGQDLEEMMIMEAMRLSLIDHEDQQRRQREEELRNQRNIENGSISTEGSAQRPSLYPGSSPPGSSATRSTLSAQSSDDWSSHRSSASLNVAPNDVAWLRRRSSPPPFDLTNAGFNTSSNAIFDHEHRAETPSHRVPQIPTQPQSPLDFSVEAVVSSADSTVSDQSYSILPSSPELSISHSPLIERSGDAHTE